MDIEPIRADTEVVEMIDGLFKVAPEGWHYVRPSPAVERAMAQGFLEAPLIPQDMPTRCVSLPKGATRCWFFERHRTIWSDPVPNRQP